jgi:hypothetical protein
MEAVDVDGENSLLTYSMSGEREVKGEVESVARRMVGGEEVRSLMEVVRDVKAGEVERSVGEEKVGHSVVIWMVVGSWILGPMAKLVGLDWRSWVRGWMVDEDGEDGVMEMIAMMAILEVMECFGMIELEGLAV